MWYQNTIGTYYIDQHLGKVWRMWADGVVSPTEYDQDTIRRGCDRIDTPPWASECLRALEHYYTAYSVPFMDMEVHI